MKKAKLRKIKMHFRVIKMLNLIPETQNAKRTLNSLTTVKVANMLMCFQSNRLKKFWV